MAYDIEIEPGETLGEWLHGVLEQESCVEHDGWAAERLARVSNRLQANRPAAERLEPVLLWLSVATAFTAPGKYVYFSRALVERCPDDECAALVMAHELAHHDLRHVELLPRWLARAAHAPGRPLAGLVVQQVMRRLYGPERECDADRHALELCLSAGYDGERCLHLFDILEQYSLDMGDVEGVYGPERDHPGEVQSWWVHTHEWAWQRARGYLPLENRRALLLNALQAYSRKAA